MPEWLLNFRTLKNQMNYILYLPKPIADYAPVDAPSNEYLWLQVVMIITMWVMM